MNINIKEQLISIEGKALKGVPNDLLEDMLLNIGHIDSEVRDGYIYSYFYEWMAADLLTAEQLNFMIDFILKNQLLLTGIENTESDDVFTRTFSALLLVLLLAKDEKNHLSQKKSERPYLNWV